MNLRILELFDVHMKLTPTRGTYCPNIASLLKRIADASVYAAQQGDTEHYYFVDSFVKRFPEYDYKQVWAIVGYIRRSVQDHYAIHASGFTESFTTSYEDQWLTVTFHADDIEIFEVRYSKFIDTPLGVPGVGVEVRGRYRGIPPEFVWSEGDGIIDIIFAGEPHDVYPGLNHFVDGSYVSVDATKYKNHSTASRTSGKIKVPTKLSIDHRGPVLPKKELSISTLVGGVKMPCIYLSGDYSDTFDSTTFEVGLAEDIDKATARTEIPIEIKLRDVVHDIYVSGVYEITSDDEVVLTPPPWKES